MLVSEKEKKTKPNIEVDIGTPEYLKVVTADDKDFSKKDPIKIGKVGEHITFDSDALHAVQDNVVSDSDGAEKLETNSVENQDSTSNVGAQSNVGTQNNVGAQSNIGAHSNVGAQRSDNVVISDKVETLKPVKIETFDHTVEAPDLEASSLKHSNSELNSQKNEKLQNLVPYPIPQSRIIDPLDVTGESGEILVREKCDEFSCFNQGKCVDDGTVYRNKLRCDCQLGSTGQRCEKGE